MSFHICNYYLPGVCELPTAYLSGASDRQSVIDELAAALNDGAVMAAVVPASDAEFDFYRSLGFAEFFMIERTKVLLRSLGEAEEKVVDLPPERACECNETFFSVARWRGHVMRDEFMWRMAADKVSANGGILAVEREGKLAGYAFYEKLDGEAVIDELFCEDEPAFIALQRAVIERCGTDSATLCAPACPHGAVRYGMLRALDCKPLIEAGLKRRPGDFAIEVADEELDRSARYEVSDGSIAVCGRRGSAALTPGQFAAVILGGGPAPYMNMVL